MQPYDLFMIVVLVGATLFGAMKGMAWQMASLGSIVLSYSVALSFSESLAPVFHAQAPWNRFIAMLVLYVLTSFAVWLAFRVVAGAIDRVRLKEFDRQIGAIFGAAKGVLLCVAITFFAVTLSANARGSVLKSRSGGYIAQLLTKADAVMPKELHDVLDPYMNRLERGLNPDEPDPATAEQGDLLRDTVGRQVGRRIEEAGEAVGDTWRDRFGESAEESDDRSWLDRRRSFRDDSIDRDADVDRPALR